ncbi:MAG: CpsD/CapB family tyrosine-protein kinase [bacterium]
MFSRKAARPSRHPLVLSLSDPQSPHLEAYRRLYRKILYLLQQNGSQVLCITSAQGSEGKTLTGINLAFAMAEDPTKNVALVDCDFRKPRVARYLGIRSGPGVASVLRGERALREVMTRADDSRPNLSVFPAGRIEGDLYPFLYSKKLEPILNQLRAGFDLVVADSPPILPILDQDFLSDLADAVLLVVRAGSASKDTVKAALECTEGKKILGVVFNGAKKQYSSYYSYTYGYDYRYDQDSDEESRC